MPVDVGSAARRAAFADRVAFAAVLTTFCAASLAWSLIAAVLRHILPTEPGAALGRRAIGWGFGRGLALMCRTGRVELDLGQLDGLAADGPAVICCNHLSLLDAVLVISRVPDAVCIAKARLWDNPALGGAVRFAGYIRNDAPLALVRDAAGALRDGRSLVVFPEGTRGDGTDPLRFKPGFTLMARAAGVPIRTVLITSNTRYLGPGWPLGRMPRFPLRYRVRPGRAFQPTDDATGLADAIARYMTGALRDEAPLV